MIAQRLAWLAVLAVGSVTGFPAPLTAGEGHGRAIYEQGQGKGPIKAKIGAAGVEAQANGFPCAGCHGVDGLGGREGGAAPPDITWGRLARPGGGYDAVAFARAVRDGIAPDGRILHPAMPRYVMDDADLAALMEHLDTLKAAAPGVSGSEIRVATLLPTSGPLAQAGREVAIVLGETVRSINRRGGLHGRRLVLHPLRFDPAVPGNVLAVVKGVLESQPPFCFLANVGVEPDDVTVRTLRAHGVPDIAPLSVSLRDDETWTVPLEPSVTELAQALAAAQGGRGRKLALLADDDERGRAAERALRDVGIDVVEVADGDWDGSVAHLKAAGVPAVLVFGRAAAAERLMGAARAVGWRPALLGPADRLLHGALPDETLLAASEVLLAGPATPTDPARALDFRRTVAGLGGTRDDLHRHAYAGALLLEEGLKRAGRVLSRDQLLEAIRGIESFDPGVLAKRSLRLGAPPDSGAVMILRYERTLRRFVPVDARG